MGRKSLPIIEGKKLCRGKHGCNQLLPLGMFDKQQDIYYFSHCKDCEKKRQRHYRKLYQQKSSLTPKEARA